MNIGKQIEIIQAVVDGKIVKGIMSTIGCSTGYDEFDVNIDHNFDFKHNKYWIKEEPEYKQWEDLEHINNTMCFKYKKSVSGSVRTYPTLLTKHVIKIGYRMVLESELFEYYLVSYDHGKTWYICGDEVKK